jgi:hypothetical protein
MAMQHMRHVKDGRSPREGCVRDRKHGLQEPIEICRGHGAPLERQRLVAVVPPAMRNTGWKEARLSSSDGDRAAGHAPRQHATHDHPFLALTRVNMDRRPDTMRRNATIDLQDDLTSITNATKTQYFPGMTILELKVSIHHIFDVVRRASGNSGRF